MPGSVKLPPRLSVLARLIVLALGVSLTLAGATLLMVIVVLAVLARPRASVTESLAV